MEGASEWTTVLIRWLLPFAVDFCLLPPELNDDVSDKYPATGLAPVVPALVRYETPTYFR